MGTISKKTVDFLNQISKVKKSWKLIPHFRRGTRRILCGHSFGNAGGRQDRKMQGGFRPSNLVWNFFYVYIIWTPKDPDQFFMFKHNKSHIVQLISLELKVHSSDYNLSSWWKHYCCFWCSVTCIHPLFWMCIGVCRICQQ